MSEVSDGMFYLTLYIFLWRDQLSAGRGSLRVSGGRGGRGGGGIAGRRLRQHPPLCQASFSFQVFQISSLTPFYIYFVLFYFIFFVLFYFI